MTVAVQTPFSSFLASGSATFAYAFKVNAAADLIVKINGVTQASSLYSVTGVGTSAGSVVFISAPTAGAIVTVQRKALLQRTTDYQSNGDFLAGTVNPDFDAIWMSLQDYQYQQTLSLQLSPADIVGVNTTLPTPAGGTVIGWNATGTALVNFVLQAGTSLVNLAASTGSSLVGFIQSGTGAVARTVQDKARESVSVKDFGAVGDGVVDDTSAIQAAINTNSSLNFGNGVFLCGPLTIPATARGAVYSGSGFYHYGSANQTVIKAKNAAQPYIFSLANGADCVTFQNLKIDGDSKAIIGIDATYGAFFTMEGCGVYNTTSYGAYHKQGLARYRRVFFQNLGVGLQLYSDSSVSDSEFTNGTIPLLLVAGGNRISNIWANTGSVCQIRLQPFDASTTHINTSMVNLYVGENASTVSTPIIDLAGTVAQAIQHVQISNSFIVQAVAGANKVNGGILLNYANDTVISNVTMFAMGSVATATNYSDYFLKAANSSRISITGCNINGVNRNAVNLGTGVNAIDISGTMFYNCAGYIGSGTQGAAIISSDFTTKGNITGCSFIGTSGSAVPYVADIQDSRNWGFSGLLLSYNSGVNIVSANSGTYPVSGTWTQNGALAATISNPSFSGMTISATVGAAGASAALPAQPLGYLATYINGNLYKIPYYNP